MGHTHTSSCYQLQTQRYVVGSTRIALAQRWDRQPPEDSANPRDDPDDERIEEFDARLRLEGMYRNNKRLWCVRCTLCDERN